MIFIYSYSFNYVVFLRRSSVVVQVSVVLKRTVVDSDLIFDNLWLSFLCRIRVSCLISTDVIKLCSLT